MDRIRTRAVILDLDDTLFDHRTSARAGLAHLLAGAECDALYDRFLTLYE